MLVSFLAKSVQVRIRRRVRGPRRPTWTPRMEALVELLQEDLGRLEHLSFAEIRARGEVTLMRSNAVDRVRIERVEGAVCGEWVVPRQGATERVVHYLHGGGYCVGSPKSHRDLLSRIALGAGARVFALDYRLAPEHRFPAPIEDAVAAHRWLLDGGVSPSKLVIGGDSAGGGLTLGTLLTLRDAHLPLPAGAVLLSPWLDLEGARESLFRSSGLDWIDVGFLHRCARDYLGGADPKDPRASPVHADLQGLPPMLLQVGTVELLFDEALTFAERARAAGVALELDVWEDMIHVFQLFAQLLPQGGAAIEKICAFIRATAP